MEPFIELFEYCFNICLEISRIGISYNYACLIRKKEQEIKYYLKS